MAQITIDTNELQQNAQNIVNLTKDVINEFNLLFKRIEEVPYISNEWTGTSSEKFSALAKQDKLKYYKFVDDLNIYSKFLLDFATSIENSINTIKGRL